MKPSSAGNANEEIAGLIATLHQTGARLELLTGGEVDSVIDAEGRNFMLQSAQERLRHSEAAKQAAILNALPARIALLDRDGLIISVNEAWRRFSSSSALPGPEYGLSLNYLAVCDCVAGAHAAEARRVAAGIRAVLDGAAGDFSLEYACHTPAERRWFLLSVTPVEDGRRTGAVIMHSNVTAVRLTEESLRASDLRFRQMAENIRDAFFLIDAASNRVLYISPAYEELWSRTCESLYADAASWLEAVHPDDRETTSRKYQAGIAAGTFEFEFRIARPDGSIRWMQVRSFPVRDEAGAIVRITGVAEDITERKMADEVLHKRAAELERFHRLSVGRELQMIELKKQINELARQAGQAAPYDVAALDATTTKPR